MIREAEYTDAEREAAMREWTNVEADDPSVNL